jgi:hypothetical protein
MNYLLRGQIASRLSGTYSALIACAFTYILTQGVIMIRRFVGAAAIIAAVFLPVATQAQGVPGGVERGAR